MHGTHAVSRLFLRPLRLSVGPAAPGPPLPRVLNFKISYCGNIATDTSCFYPLQKLLESFVFFHSHLDLLLVREPALALNGGKPRPGQAMPRAYLIVDLLVKYLYVPCLRTSRLNSQVNFFILGQMIHFLAGLASALSPFLTHMHTFDRRPLAMPVTPLPF